MTPKSVAVNVKRLGNAKVAKTIFQEKKVGLKPAFLFLGGLGHSRASTAATLALRAVERSVLIEIKNK